MSQLFISKRQIVPDFSIHKDKGMVLPTVLWITILIIVVASNYASSVHVHAKALDNIKTAMALKYDSLSGVYIALDGLLSGKLTGYAHYSSRINDNRIDIIVRPESMKTSLNTANISSLRRAFMNAGLEPENAEVFAARVIDWRDPDTLPQNKGMEDVGYYSLGREYGAKDARFEDIVELMLIPGIDEHMFMQVADHFTIYGKGSGRIFSITSRASNPEGTKSYVVKSVIQLTYQSVKPYRVLKWQYNQS